ncbi:uncharacterized protein RCC_07443 [Ramularia collo-cygni]|uniref:Uncharacterized protein n=1 Tax=Ramularia collo-cygni TaxID=112498 RepID=A0A2D3VHY3_9PEZI|nr:uncharacterized protein RCC_07443 [Ramularia collo-cygni]CZT21579.1 uncharacterized protein RCC_07443 [Ramularia collo-cygni]
MSPLPSPLKSMLPPAPRPDACNVEVRMVRDITLHSDLEEVSSTSERRDSGLASPPECPQTPCRRRDLGATKVNRRGNLDSDSDASSPDPTPRAVSVILSPEKRLLAPSPTKRPAALRDVESSCNRTRTAARPVRAPQSPSVQREYKSPKVQVSPYIWTMTEASSSSGAPVSQGTSQIREPLGELPVSFDEIDRRGRESAIAETRQNFRNPTIDSRDASPSMYTPTSTARVVPPHVCSQPAELSEEDVKAWQRGIQRNYQQSLEDKENNVVLQAETWSDDDEE